MPKATLIKDNQRVAVESGSKQAQDLFGQGYKLETKSAGDLSGTMNELPSELPGLGENTSQFANFRNLLTDMTRAAYDKKPSIKDALSQFNTQIGAGTGVVSPTISGAVLDTERQRRIGNMGDIFAKTMNTINSMEKIRGEQIQNVNSLMGDLATAGLLDQLTGKEFEQIRQTGVLPMETLQKISAKVNEIKNKPETPSYPEQIAGLEAGYTNVNGVPVKTDGTYDPITGVATDQSKVLKIGNQAYNFTSYAKDPGWGKSVNQIMTSLPEFISNQEVNNYIQSQAPGSLLKAEDIKSIANETGIAPELLLSIAAHESAWGTSNVAKTNNNLVGYSNTGMEGTDRPEGEGGTYTKFNSPKESLMALANNIKRREIDQSTTPQPKSEADKISEKLTAEQKAVQADINVELDKLSKGGDWGTSWNYIKNRYPDIPTDVLDEALRKDQFYPKEEIKNDKKAWYEFWK